MKTSLRDKLGRFRTNILTAYEAGKDAVLRGADLVNCNFCWFLSVYSKDEWERGQADGKKILEEGE